MRGQDARQVDVAVGGEINRLHVLRCERRGGRTRAEVEDRGIARVHTTLEHKARTPLRIPRDELVSNLVFTQYMDNALAERVASELRQIGDTMPEPRDTNGDVELRASDGEIVARDAAECSLALRDEEPHRLPCENQTFLHNVTAPFKA